MQEAFLHYLWQYQYFDKSGLQTTAGQPLHILRPGVYNTNAGPDFAGARVMIDGVTWVGHVEIHLSSGDWFTHKHHTDAAYENVVLHVVWQHDKTAYRADGTVVPVLALANRTDMTLLHRYQFLVKHTDPIPCTSRVAEVPSLYLRLAFDQALMQRLQAKAALVRELLTATGGDWEETAYQLLARNMGFKVNADPFLRLAKAVPLKILRKHADSLLHLEALLFGQAGFLDESFTDEYPLRLQREYQFLRHKYQWQDGQLGRHEWKYARLRPANFPALRIAQLASLLFAHQHLFARFTGVATLEEALKILNPSPSDYWLTHHHFGKATVAVGRMGQESRENIVINTCVPLLAACAGEKDNPHYLERAVSLLESIPAENNVITRQWRTLGVPVQNAFDAQASIELFNEYCTKRQCLRCPVGTYVLRKG